MERERERRRAAGPRPGGGSGPGGGSLDGIRAEAEEILAAADRVLDSIRPVEAEEYLQRNLQRGGE